MAEKELQATLEVVVEVRGVVGEVAQAEEVEALEGRAAGARRVPVSVEPGMEGVAVEADEAAAEQTPKERARINGEGGIHPEAKRGMMMLENRTDG